MRSMSSASTQCAEVAVTVGPRRRAERRTREPRRVQHHLLDRDDVLAVGRELGDVVGDAALDVETALADEEPRRTGDERLRRREDDVPGARSGGADGLERSELP